MKKKIVTLLLVGMILFSVPAWAGAADMIQDQTRTQDQTQTPLMDQDQTRIQLRDRLYINDEAKIQLQDRLQTQDQDSFCFPDIQQHWAREQVRTSYSWGLVNGYTDGNFNPNGNITGTEAVIMMSRLMNCIVGNEAGTGTAGDINWDVVPLWARETMRETTALRIASQCQYYGEQQLNRLQFAVMLAKSLGIEQATVPEGTIVFQDQNGIPAADLGYVQALKNLGIVAGDNENFCPTRLVTRAEAAVMLTRVLDVLE